MKKTVKSAAMASVKPYGRRYGDRPNGEDRLTLEITTRGMEPRTVEFPAGVTLQHVDAMIEKAISSGLNLQMDDHQHIVLPAEMVKNSVFIVKTGGA